MANEGESGIPWPVPSPTYDDRSGRWWTWRPHVDLHFTRNAQKLVDPDMSRNAEVTNLGLGYVVLS